MKSIDQIRRENLVKLREEAGSQRALAAKLERDESQVSQWSLGSTHSATGKQRGMRTETARYIEAKMDKAPGWLDMDHEVASTVDLPQEGGNLHISPARLPAHLSKQTNVTAGNIPLRRGLIPVVGRAQLGDDGYFCELDHPVGHGDGSIEWATRDENAYALRCQGESMKPRIRHGEYVIVEPNREVMPGDEVLVKSNDGRVMVKQLAFIRDGMVHLDSVNESHPRVSILQEEIAVMHYVAGIAKSALWSAPPP